MSVFCHLITLSCLFSSTAVSQTAHVVFYMDYFCAWIVNLDYFNNIDLVHL